MEQQGRSELMMISEQGKKEHSRNIWENADFLEKLNEFILGEASRKPIP